MAVACPGDLAGLRDRALLLFAAAAPGLGRAALVGLDAERVRFTPTGVALALADRRGDALRTVTLARGAHRACRVRALEAWLHASDTRFGPVFRKVHRWGNVEHHRLGADTLRRIWATRALPRHRPRVAAHPKS